MKSEPLHIPKPIPPLDGYAWKDLHRDVQYVFVGVHYLLKELWEVAVDAVQQRPLEKALPPQLKLGDGLHEIEKILNASWLAPRNSYQESPPVPAEWEYLCNRLTRVREDIGRFRRVLYVAERGLLTSKEHPARIISSDGKSYFERSADDVADAVASFNATGINDWHSIDNDGRGCVMWKWRRTGGSWVHQAILEQAFIAIDSMWTSAQMASRYIDLPADQRRILVDGTWIFERIAFLAEKGEVDADTVPIQLPDPALWLEYATLMDDLAELAGTLGQSSSETIGPLKQAKAYAQAMHRDATNPNAEPQTFHIDDDKFGTAHDVLRNSSLAAIKAIAPDRKAFYEGRITVATTVVPAKDVNAQGVPAIDSQEIAVRFMVEHRNERLTVKKVAQAAGVTRETLYKDNWKKVFAQLKAQQEGYRANKRHRTFQNPDGSTAKV